MGIFNDLGFKKNTNNELVAPNANKVGGKTIAQITTEIATRIGTDVILSSDADGVVSITNFTNVNKSDFFGDGSNIATYFFDGDATDARGSYNGVSVGSTFSYITGRFGQAIYRPTAGGNNTNYINLNYQPPLPSSTSLYTISGWCYYDGTSAINLLGSAANTQNQIGVMLGLTATGYLWTDGWNFGGYTGGLSSPMSTGIVKANIGWNHIVMIKTAQYQYSTYINGVFDKYFSWNQTIPSTVNSNLIIGCRYLASYGGGSDYKVDNLRIFNRALTSAEVTSLYNEPVPQNLLFQQDGQGDWYEYKAKATDFTAGSKLFINGTQQMGTYKLNSPDFFGDNSNVATYLFNGNVTDARGTYNGVATNITYGVGKFGQCAIFNGTNSFISGLQTWTMKTDFSFSFWIKGTVVTGASQFIFGHVLINTQTPSGLAERFYCLIDSVGKIALDFTCGVTGNVLTGNNVITDGLWHHIVFTNNNGTVNLYVDDIFQGSKIYTVPSNVSIKIPQIGRQYRTDVSPTAYLNASLDNIRTFDRVLTPTEVTELYNEGNITFDRVKTDTRKLDVVITNGTASKVDIDLYTGDKY